MRYKFRVCDSRTEEMTDDVTLYSNGWIGCVFPSGHEEKYEPGCDHIHVRQWTGLTDRNGKEIYEGDVLRDRESFDEIYIYEVKWCSEDCRFIFNDLHGPDKYMGGDLYLNQIDIIGNIYENPELINS